MKKIAFILLGIAIIMGVCGCKKESESSKKEEKKVVSKESSKKTISLITDFGNVDDGSFNEGSWNGVVEFAELYGYEKNYYRALFDDDDERKKALEQAVEEGTDILVCPGSEFSSVIYKKQEECKDKIMLLIDSEPQDEDGKVQISNNVHCIKYKEEQVGYLAGYAAVKEGYRKLGFLGGMAYEAVIRFGYGFVQGAEAAAKDMNLKPNEVEVKYMYGGAFSPSKEITAQMRKWYNEGTEVVFSCGGGILYSVIEAASDDKTRKIIGVDVDQSKESEQIIFSAMKGLTESVRGALEKLKENGGKWPDDMAGKTANVGVEENCVGLSISKESWKMKNFTVKEYNEVYNRIKNDKLDIDGKKLPKLSYVDYRFIDYKPKK